MVDSDGRLGALEIELARVQDADAIAAVRTEAAKWLVDHQKPNDWPVPFPVGLVLGDINRRILHVVRVTDSDRLAGTITLDWSDVENWGVQAPDAGYVHGLAVSPELRGRQIGKEMLDWADRQVRRRGRRYLRLDCMVENFELRHYYELLGFVFRGNGLSATNKAALYERIVPI